MRVVRNFLLASMFLCLLLDVHAQQELDIDSIKRATVFILQAQNVEDDLVITCVGSGTIVSPDGLIVTNAHNTVQNENCQGDTLIVAMTLRLDDPPIPKYRAEIAQFDAGLDLALLRINRELDGRLIDTSSIPAFPFVEIANSNEVQLDETITIVGYSGLDNDPVTTSRGTITAFLSEPSGGDKSWIKTNATVPPTMSGSGAYNREGQLIGIPTTAPLTSSTANCIQIEDTNQDGIINNADDCIPLGDFINALRPSNFARQLIRGASLGLNVDTLTVPDVRNTPLEQPSFSRFLFAPSIANGLPTTVVGNLPAGTNSLYLFFDYINMTPETVYELRVSIDGVPNQRFSLPPVRWSGGERGIWHVGSTGQPWPNGVYEFRLLINGVAAGSQTIVIGGAAIETPAFSNLVFGIQDLQGNLLGNGYVLPSGNVASASFIYRNMVESTPWTVLWFYNGNQIARTDDAWLDGENGSKVVSLLPQGGLLPGVYRIELYIDGLLSATADFSIAGAQEGAFPVIFTDLRFVSADSPSQAIQATSLSSFPDTIESLYAIFNWQQIFPGTLWTMRWSVDDEIFFEQTNPWVAPENGDNFIVQLAAPSTIPDGTYKMDLFINDVQLASTVAEVGIGQLPIDRFASTEGIQLRGQIVDAATQNGLVNATFIVISEDFAVDEFEWNSEQIVALAISDRNGRFEVDRRLDLDTPYSILIVLEGYLPVSADGFIIDAEDGNSIELIIPLTRD